MLHLQRALAGLSLSCGAMKILHSRGIERAQHQLLGREGLLCCTCKGHDVCSAYVAEA